MALKISRTVYRSSKPCCRRWWSSSTTRSQLQNSVVGLKQNQGFDEEHARQLSLITRVEKIQVNVKGPPEESMLIMNKKLSTPYDCARHIGEVVCKLSAIAFVNGKPWDMHRPLEDDCELRFQHFLQEDPHILNKVYWRSCSYLLGLVATKAFKDQYYVELHSWPSPNVRSGSFVYDVHLKMDTWNPTKEELRVLTIMAQSTMRQDLRFERLEVDASVALKMFADNQFKREQIPLIAAASPSGNDITVYRVGDHVDISRGPMIASTSLIGPYDVTAVYPIKTDYGVLHRFQGLSLPMQIYLNSFAYGVLRERASKVNPARVPRKRIEDDVMYETPLHEKSSRTEHPAAATLPQ